MTEAPTFRTHQEAGKRTGYIRIGTRDFIHPVFTRRQEHIVFTHIRHGQNDTKLLLGDEGFITTLFEIPGVEEPLWEKVFRRNDTVSGVIVACNGGLIQKQANKYASYIQEGILTKQDLINGGTEGVLKAIPRFDPESGNRFSTFAITSIVQAMQDGIRNAYGLSREEAWAAGKGVKIFNIFAALYAREPTPSEMQNLFFALTDYGPDAITSVIRRLYIFDTPLSLRNPPEDIASAPVEIASHNDTAEEAIDNLETFPLSSDLKAALREVDPRERAILVGNIVFQKSAATLAAETGLKPAEVSSILKSAQTRTRLPRRPTRRELKIAAIEKDPDVVRKIKQELDEQAKNGFLGKKPKTQNPETILFDIRIAELLEQFPGITTKGLMDIVHESKGKIRAAKERLRHKKEQEELKERFNL